MFSKVSTRGRSAEAKVAPKKKKSQKFLATTNIARLDEVVIMCLLRKSQKLKQRRWR